MSDDAGTARIIYVCATLDTDALPPVAETSDVAHAPMPLTAGQITLTTTDHVPDTPVETLALDAERGDLLRFWATTGSYNFEDAVLITQVRHIGPATIVESFEQVKFSQVPITPQGVEAATDDTGAPTSPDDPAVQDFWFWQGRVAGDGSQDIALVLALYTRDADGQPRFAGLYRWEQALTVQSRDPQATQ